MVQRMGVSRDSGTAPAARRRSHGAAAVAHGGRRDGTGVPPASPAAGASRFELAYQRLKADIVGGVYSPNQRLVEAELTAALAVSRATVRAVLVRLQEEGLVDVEAKRGARVRAVSIEEALQILDVREVLEGFAASLAARNATADQLAELARIVDAMRRAIATDDPLGYSALNDPFHALIHEATAHDAIRTALEALHFPLIRYRFRSVLVPGRKEQSLAEHRRILECIAARDPGGAEKAMRRHVARVRAVLTRTRDAPTY